MKKNYHPLYILLFIGFCLAILGSVIYFVPSGKLKLGDYEFRFLSEQRLFKQKKQKKVDIKDLIADIDTTLTEIDDSLANKEIMGAAGNANYHISQSDLLDYNDKGKESLTRFFNQLMNATSKKIRILHYGDSQIEGDRMTGFFRQRIQEQFGGNGPGFIPAVNVYHTVAFTQTCSENFERYTNFGGTALKTKNYGILNSVGRFTKEIEVNDSILATLPTEKGWIEVDSHQYAYSRAKKYNNVYLHYTDAFTSCKIKVYQNGNLIVTDSLKADGKYHVYPFQFPGNPGKLKFEFESKVSPNILGFSLEGDIGVQVDNIGMRGSSGTFFGRINQGLAKQIYDAQNVELFIMQFGGNSMPLIKDSVAAVQNANYFRSQLYTIKKLRPNAAIIVIGPSDMSTLIEGEYTTYPLLPYFVEQLRKGTKEVGGAYFDMFAAMGGYDSMVAWVESGLAASDYIHFSNKGASIASQKFYDALMTVYAKLMKNASE